MPADSSQTDAFPVLPAFSISVVSRMKWPHEAEQQPPVIIQM